MKRKAQWRGALSLIACIAGVWIMGAYLLPFVTNSFEATRSLADYIDESGIETGQFYYTGVESTAQAEAGARASIAFWEIRQAVEEDNGERSLPRQDSEKQGTLRAEENMRYTMNRKVVTVLLTVLLVVVSSQAWAKSYQVTKKMFRDAGTSNMFDTAYGYALFPNIGKGGFGFGGAYGKGRVYEQGSYIGDSSMFQASFGFQLGGVGFSQVVFFEDKRALNDFISGNFEFGAEAQATVLTAALNTSMNTGGSSATASGGKNNAAIASGGYNKGIATFQITKGGLMYEASLGGQKFTFTRS